jgi:hypothetical protein
MQKKNHPFFYHMLWFFVINTKYICENTEKVVETCNYVYIYHCLKMSSYLSDPLIKIAGSATDSEA